MNIEVSQDFKSWTVIPIGSLMGADSGKPKEWLCGPQVGYGRASKGHRRAYRIGLGRLQIWMGGAPTGHGWTSSGYIE